jgi:putative transposase
MLDFNELEKVMARRRSEEKIVKILKEAESGVPIRDVIQKYNVSEQSFYRSRQKYGGMETSDVRRLNDLERENAELKKMVAEQHSTYACSRISAQKKW